MPPPAAGLRRSLISLPDRVSLRVRLVGHSLCSWPALIAMKLALNSRDISRALSDRSCCLAFTCERCMECL